MNTTKSSMNTKMPSVNRKKSSPTAEKPSTNIEKLSATIEMPSTNVERPSMNKHKPQAVIVEHDPFYRQILSTCLRSLNWDYGVMETGYELIEYFLHNGEPYDIAIIDTELPLLSGVETAESIKLFIPGPRILFTGHSKPDKLPDSSFFMKKPIDFPALIRFFQSISERKMNGQWATPVEQPALVKAAA